jgi:hypothetical protein
MKNKVATEEMDLLAKKIWVENKLEDKVFWQEEMWTDHEFDPAIGTIEFDGYNFVTNENSDYVTYVHNGYEGEFLK